VGEVHQFDGAEALRDPTVLRGAQVLVSRSVTRIGDRLLAEVPDLVAIACPIVGLDHLDMAALDRFRRMTGRPCPVFHAPGSTAEGVADWALAALLESSRHAGLDPARLRVGIWGYGHCGRALGRRLDRMGARWIAYDPPLEAQSAGAFKSVSVDALAACDAVSLHVPLTSADESPWPTRHMMGRGFLEAFLGTSNDSVRIVVNTSRGAVVHTPALMHAMSEQPSRLLAAVDVWDDEPRPDPRLVQRCLFATPHVAGSVIQGRARALVQVAEALRAFLDLPVPEGWLDGLNVASAGYRVSPGPFSEMELDCLAAAIGLREVSLHFKADYCAAQDPGLVFETVRRQSFRHEVNWK